MGLLDLQFPTAQVETPGGDFAVRGLSLEDLTNLMNSHQAEFGTLFDQFRAWALTEGDDKPPLTQFVVRVVSQTPSLISTVIAKAADADTPAGRAMARKLVPADQAQALEKIGRLTFRSEDELQKMLGLAIRGLDQLTRALILDSSSQLQQASGSGPIESTPAH